MKKILIVYLLFCSFLTFAQNTKTIEIVKRLSYDEYVNAICTYNSKNELEKMLIRFTCQNSKYQQLPDLITLFEGDPKAFYKYLTDRCDYYKKNISEVTDNTDISGEIDGQKVKIYKISYLKYLRVFTEVGYHDFTIKWIEKIKSQFIDWCKKNNVAYE